MLRVIMLVAGLGLVAAVKFPSFINRCARDDPEFSKCALASARAAKDNLIRGDRAFRLQPLDPLLISQLRVEQGGSVGLNITLNNINITGLKGLTFTDKFSLDLAERVLSYEVVMPRIELDSDYEIQGKILILPVNGKGRANFTLMDITMHVMSPYKLVTRNTGKEYLYFDESDVAIQPSKVYINFENLFNGDPLLGPQTNLFLNENWRQIYDDLGPSMARSIGAAIKQNIQTFMDKIPYDEFAPEKLSA